jgi:hypothetical protein
VAKQIKQASRLEKWKPGLMKFSVSVNVVVVLFLIICASAYWSGSGFLTSKLYSLNNNACAHYEDHQKVKTTVVERTVAGKERAVRAFQLTTGQHNSGCYSYAINSNVFAYTQLLQLPTTQAIPIFFGSNGQNLEGIPNLRVPPLT